MTPEQIEKEAEIYAQVQHGDPAKFPGLSKSEIYQSTKDDFTAGWEQCANWAISQLPPAQRWVEEPKLFKDGYDGKAKKLDFDSPEMKESIKKARAQQQDIRDRNNPYKDVRDE